MIDCMISLAGGSILWASRKPAAGVVSVHSRGGSCDSFLTVHSFIHSSLARLDSDIVYVVDSLKIYPPRPFLISDPVVKQERGGETVQSASSVVISDRICMQAGQATYL